MQLTLEQLRKKSEKRLSGLHPVFKLVLDKLVERCHARGVWVLITQGSRTYVEQDALYAQGRTKPGQVVTKARGGYSNHNFGFAADFALLLRDGRTVSWDTLRDDDKDSLPDWSEVVEEAKGLGLEWGGDWRSFKDMPHLQMVFGLSTADFRAGKRPSKAQLIEALAKINRTEDDEPMTAEEKAAFKELQNTVQKQADRIKTLETAAKQPKVPAWAEQACINAKGVGVLDTANDGSYDFYRLVTILDRAGVFKKGSVVQ
ncbi:MAG: M15 family metallopeptidase [Bacillota bacterium]